MCPLPCNIEKGFVQNQLSNIPSNHALKYRDNQLAKQKFILFDFYFICCVEYSTVGTFLLSYYLWITITVFKYGVAFFLSLDVEMF